MAQQPPQGYGPPPGYAQQGYAPPPPPKQGTSTAVKLLAAFGLLGLLGMGTCATCAVIGASGAAKAVNDAKVNAAAARETQPASAPAAAAAPEPAERVEIKTLLSEYKDNEVRADGAFKGKRVRVEGKVGDVKKDILNHPYVTVGTGQMFEIPTVQCMLEDSEASAAAQLSKGAQVAVEGTVKGLMMNVLIDDCVIAK